MQLRPADLHTGHRVPGQARKSVTDMSTMRRVPDHDMVRIEHRGAVIDGAIGEAFVQPPLHDVEYAKTALTAHMVEEVSRE